MERRHFLGLAFGLVAATALAAGARAAPLLTQPLAGADTRPLTNEDVRPAVTSRAEVDQLKPEQVHWRHHWHRRHWGWHHHHWRHHRWHRHHWHHRHWRHW